MTDLENELATCRRVLESTVGAAALHGAIDAAFQRLVGRRLLTMLVVVEGGLEVERIYTSDPAAYPLTGRKRMGPTPWGQHVITEGRIWHGRDPDALAWAFPDHELIASLGCGSCMNIPVKAGGRVLGTINVLDRSGAYGDDTPERLAHFAPLLLLSFQAAAARVIAP